MKTNKQILELCTWARERGAVLLKVGDVEFTFPPPVEEVKSSRFEEVKDFSYEEWLSRQPLPSVTRS